MKQIIFVILTLLVLILTMIYLEIKYNLPLREANAAPAQVTEYGVRKTYDEDAICYTAFMKNGLETGLSISCIPRPKVCDSQNEKGDKLYAEIPIETVSHNSQ